MGNSGKKNANDEIIHQVDNIVAELGTTRSCVIPILQAIQNEFKYLPQDALHRVCEISDITPAAIIGVSSFYPQFRYRPVGEHVIQVCTGTACHVKGADAVLDALRRHLHIPNGDDTDPDQLFTIQNVACLGCCTLAPVVQIDDVTYGHTTPDGVSKMVEDFLNSPRDDSHENLVKDKDGNQIGEIHIGLGSCCIASGSGQVHRALSESLVETGIKTHVKRVGCVGMCHQTPLLEVCTPDKPPAFYAKVEPEDVKGILQHHFKPNSLHKRIGNAVSHFLESAYSNEPDDPITRRSMDVRDPQVTAFLSPQQHITTEFCGIIDPTDLDEYQYLDGFKALKTCLAEMSPEQVIDRITKSGLRGRGGAGYPTGQKWLAVHQAGDNKKFIICNGDEGDPGAFMDRMLLESYPFRVIEGMIIAAYAVGASEGYFYIRAEYPLAVRRVREALQLCEEQGFLGKDILMSGFSLKLQIMEGASAFVCGEETALIASIEGKRGMPRYRPPFPAQSGLWEYPTLVNNCETYAVVPWIMRNDAEEFAKFGTEESKGTKVFSLAGKIKRGGLIEVPMGITIREIIEDIGGGIEGGKRFKAIQIGGPSGGCVPASLADTKVDYEDLTKAGSMMGSGGLLVMDESDCMVDITRYFLNFTYNQSCGRCTFCRIGIRRMLTILDNMCTGKGHAGDLEKLEELAVKTTQLSLCGLGKTAPNPILTTLQYFRNEYEAHLQGKCPAKKCKGLITYSITVDCIGCTLCSQHCPADAIAFNPYRKHEIDPEKCTKCDTCKQVCPVDAVKVE